MRIGCHSQKRKIWNMQKVSADDKPYKSFRDNQPQKKIGRTSAGLRDALFDAIEMVRSGDMSSGDAQAIALLSGSICKTVQLEIEVAKLRTEYPADAKLIIPTPLTLGEPKDG